MENRVWRLRSRPSGALKDTELELCHEAIPVASGSDFVVKTEFVSVDPTHRIWMSDIPQYMPCVPLGDVMRAATVGIITQSANPEWPVGTHVYGFGGVCDYYLGTPGVNVMYKAGECGGLPLTADLSVCSVIIGLTAWYGVNKVLDVTAADTVVVSGAAGAVGSLVGQLAKLKGARVLGIAGGATKCAWMRNELGFDAAVDYKSEDVAAAVQAFAPDGVTCYFDNVGGAVTDAVLLGMRNAGRVAVCGSISEYDDQWAGQKNWNLILMRRLKVQGFICIDLMHKFAEAKTELAELVAAGKIKYSEDVREGIETYPSLVRLLMSGGNTGKLILKL